MKSKNERNKHTSKFSIMIQLGSKSDGTLAPPTLIIPLCLFVIYSCLFFVCCLSHFYLSLFPFILFKFMFYVFCLFHSFSCFFVFLPILSPIIQLWSCRCGISFDHWTSSLIVDNTRNSFWKKEKAKERKKKWMEKIMEKNV